MNNIAVTLDGTGTIAVSQWTSLTDSSLKITGGDYAPTSGAATSDNSFTSLSDINGSSLYVSGGGSLSLPGVSSIANGEYYGGTYLEVVDTSAGGALDLPNLTTVSGYYGVTIEAAGAQSQINLPALTSFDIDEGGQLEAVDNGTINLNPGLTSLTGVTIVVDGTGTLPTSQFASVTDGGITVEAGDYTSAFPNLTDINGSSLYVYGAGSLTLPAVANYANNSGGRYFQAYQPNTSYGQTPTVGTLSLPNLASIGGDYGVQVEAQGSGSTIELPDLTSFSPTDSGYSAMSVTDDGTVLLAAGLTSLNGVTIVLDGTGTLSNGTSSSATTQFISITDGGITVAEGDYSSAFPNLADINGSSLRVYGGGSLTLPAVTTYTNNNGYEYLQAAEYADYDYTTQNYYGSGSVGVLSLPALTAISGADVIVVAAGTGSAIELPALTAFNGSSYGSLSVTASATIEDGDLTTLNDVWVTLDGTGTMAVSQWTSLTLCVLNIESGDYAPTSGAATADNSFTNLADIDASSIFVFGGGSLTLPAVTTYTNNSGRWTYLQSYEPYYYETVGLFSLPALTSIVGSYVDISAYRSGSEIELPELTTLDFAVDGYLAYTNQGLVSTPSLSTLVNVALTTDSTATLTVPANQTVSFSAGASTITTGTVVDQGSVVLGGSQAFTLANYAGGGTGIIQTKSASQSSPSSFDISVNIADPTEVYTLINSAYGEYGDTVGAVEFEATGGLTYTVDLVEGENIRDHNNDGYEDSIGLGALGDTYLGGASFGGGQVRLDEQGFVLPAAFQSATLTDIILLGYGNVPDGLPFMAAATVATPNGPVQVNINSLVNANLRTYANGGYYPLGGSTITANATVNIAGGLTINGSGALSVGLGSTLNVSGNLLGNTTNAAGFNILGTVVLDGTGTSSSPQQLEVMSQDLGGTAAGFQQNFAYNTLELANDTYVNLVDDLGGNPEALYVDNLIVPAGTTLNLNGLNLYIHTAQVHGTIIGGAIVTGEVFDDVSGSGKFASGDPGLLGWTVELKNTATNATYTTTTDINGDYAFAGVQAGTYTLSEVLQSGFARTAPASPGTFALTISSGQVITGENFGDHPTAAIGGVVFNDLNGDGTLESGEPGLKAWTVQLLNSSNAVIATATTNSGGNYSFSSLLPGTYTVQVVSQSGYVATSPASVTLTDDNGQADTVNFGEFVPVVVSGEVFNDPNDSGKFVPGDTGLSGWTVELVLGSQVLQATSGSGGLFSFSNVGPGSYTLEVVQQTGWVATNSPVTIAPTSGANIPGEYLGEFQSSTISGQVFNDVAGNGTYASGDPGLSGWTVDLLNSAYSVVASAQTDANGNYTLTGVVPGTYTVEESPKSGYIQTTAPAIYYVKVVKGQNLAGLNFGDFQLATVSGELFDDLSDDGNLDPGDPGEAGWTVNLLNSASKVVATTTTGSGGDYSFSGVGPGTYNVVEVIQAGYIQTAPSSGGLTVTTSSGTTFTGDNFGVFKTVSLSVSGLATTPATGLQSGSSLVIKWTDTNTGTLPASGSFIDQVVITNTTTGDVLATGTVPYNAASQGNLAAGASVAQQYAFSLPNGYPGAGQIQFAVTADYHQNVSTPAGEPTNTATLTETSTLASYPNLVTSDVTAPATADPGQPISVDWTLANDGSGTAAGPWTEQVSLATDSNGDNPTLVEVQTFTGSLAAGQSVARSADVLIPSLPPGNYWIVVSENPLGELFELDTTKNTAIAAQPTSIAGGLSLTLSSDTESNAAGNDATTATVTRNTDTTNSLLVTITNSDPNDVTAPQTVTIPAGATSVSFAVGTINNHVVEGTQTATLTASATGLVSGSDRLTVTETNVATLTVVLNSHTVNETDTNPATFGTVTRNTPTTSALTVSLLSNQIRKLTVPATVTIPAGATSATFPVAVVNDGQIDGNETATITASASSFQSGSDSAVVVDDNVPSLTLALAQSTVSEAAGANATTGTVSIKSPTSGPITIVLGSSDTMVATVPTSVVIDAGQESASFPIAAIDNSLNTTNESAVITANVESDAGVIVVQGSAEASLVLENVNGPALSLSFAAPTVFEGSTATATVTRNTATGNSLVVTLLSSDPTEAAVQPTVTIPPGQASVSFAVEAVQNGVPQGLQDVQISATTAGLDTGIATLGITDVELPDLVVSNVTAPASGYDNTPLTVSWTVTNSGQYPASGSWVDQIYLDPAGGPQSSSPADSVTFTGTVNAGQSYTQTDTMTSPSAVGLFFVRVVTDSGQSVQELNFNNNTGLAAQPFNDQAAYTATVSPSATTVTAGTPVVLSGVATMTSNGAPAVDEPVAVQILVGGTTRTLTATTDSNGDYSVTFQPLPNEAGQYSVTAADPGVTNPAVQAQFEIIGMTATPATANVTVVPNTPLTGTFTLTNLSDVALSGLTATSSGAPSGLTVQLTTPTGIAGDGTATLGYSLDDTSTQAASGVVTIQLTTAQGATLDILVGVTVRPLQPVLAANPGYLDSGMVVGGQTLVSFTVENNGGAPSGNLQVSLPFTTYMTLASPATIPSLAPGASSTVTVELTPPSNLPLEEYAGTIGIGGAGIGMSVPFTFRAITTATGDVHVLVDDDYTFDVAGAPHVQGATVSLLDPYDNTHVIATGVTDATGAVTFTNLPAGPYDLQVTAPGHGSYDNSFTVVPGITNSDEVFIQRQFVTYTWNVVQTTIQDTYQIQLQTTFATDVPAPVVTITAPASIPTLVPGQSWTFNATITNHGLIAAQGVTLNMPSDPEYTFTALSTDIGVVPAMSSVEVPITVTRVAPQSLAISDGGTTLTANVVVPNPVTSDTASTVYVDYSNTGTVAIPAPLLVLTATQGSSQGAFLSLDPSLAGLAYNANATPSGFSDSVQFLASGATPGMLEPGESETIPVYFAGWLSSQWSGAPVTFSLSEVTADNSQPIDWPSVAPGVRPSSINVAAWDAITPLLAAQIGSTWGQYVQTLDNDAAYLAGIGEPTTDLSQLLSFEVEKANAAFTAQTLVSVTPDSLPAPGLNLSFTQSFQASISDRYTSGILGFGWTTNWDISATTMTNGDVAILECCSSRYFSLQPNGSFAPEAGDQGTTLTSSGGAYQLVAPDGIDYQFNTNGTLNYVQDTHGNRITAGYNAQGQLTSLTDSNGEYLDLAYNAQGRLATLTDSNGQTENYGYDPTGQFLTSYTDLYGTTNYTYVTGQSAAQDNALAGIAYADNTHIYFAYDSQGRLIDQHRDGGQEDQTWTYLSPGGYVTSDANGNQATVYFDRFGDPAVTIDPLGNVTRAAYDRNLNLTQVVGPNGNTHTFTYDANGNLTSETDPLGLTTNFTYDAANNLTSYTDTKGNTTQYGYNSANDLLSITYANGTEHAYTYNPLGEATQYLNANGQAIGYTYNAQGLVVTENFGHGTSYSYSYSAQGNLTSATDAQGHVTSFLYGNPNNPDLLTEVDYPDGTWLKFSYNIVGQRTQSVDQTGFTTNYAYDSLGRLSELTDGSGNLIVQYTYDAAGNLIQKDMGNGTRTAYTYNGDGNVLSITNYALDHVTVNSFDDYTYNALGNVLTDTNQDGEWVYNYDADSQLVQAVFTPNSTNPDGLTAQDLQYVYDAAGNRISETVNGVTTTYVANNVNEYTSSTTNGVTTSYQYDFAGNLIAQSVGASTTTYTFNVLNELTAVNGPGLTASYGYDPLGNLITRTSNGVITDYQIDPAGLGKVVASFDGRGTLTAHFAYGLGLTSQVNTGGVAYYYDFNLQGSTTGITNAQGSLVNRYTFDPFGQVAAISTGVVNPFTFVGEYGVMQIAGDLSYMRARVYSTSIAHFISRDPLGPSSGSDNLYEYAGNNTIEYTDPTGLFKVKKCFDYNWGLPNPKNLGIGGWYDAKTDTIWINEAYADIGTFPHEQTHASLEWLSKYFGVSTEGAAQFVGDLTLFLAWITFQNQHPYKPLQKEVPCPPFSPPGIPPPPPSGLCALPLGATWSYQCGGHDVTSQAVTIQHASGRSCSSQAVAAAIAGFGGGGGGGGIPPGILIASNCNPAIPPILQQDQHGLMDAGDPPIDTAPPVAGTDHAANAAGTNGNLSPLAFVATALGNLGLINGQSGNDGYSPAQAAQMVSTIATLDQVEADISGILITASGQGASLGITGDINLLQQVDSRLEAVTTAENSLFGGDANWLNTTQSATAQQWMTAFFTDAQNSSDGAISAADMAQLLATTLPNSVSVTDATEFLNHWNRTVQYWSQGVFTAAQVPAGQSTEFLDLGAIQTAFNAAVTAEQWSQVNGYSDVGAEVQGALKQVESDLEGQGVCATIKLQIDQSATLTRSAFSGTLTITNSEGTGAMSNVVMDINITDAQGNPANGQFFISSPAYSGAFNVVNGVATLPDFSTGTIAFTFIPDDSAASHGPTQYNIGGTIGFTDPAGGAVTIPVFPSTITVNPQPELQLNYFLQTDVIGEDPFTPQDVITPEPAVLGLLVTNVGGGTANNLSITTAQPQIVQNAKGLLDTFQIIGTQVGNQSVTPSLTVDFGNIAPGQTADASFLLLSSLEGLFENFTATFSHSDALGGKATSLITSVVTHSLVHAGDFNFPDSTGATDYLVDNVPNPESLPDTIYFSDGTTAAVNVASGAASSQVGPSSALTFQVTANVTSGWDYVQLPDPGAGYTLYKVVRSDGSAIPVPDQAWTTDRTISPTGRSTVDYELHLLDDNSTGSYLVYYRPTRATAPTVASISSVSSPQQGAVGSVDVAFSEPIDATTFTTANLNLTLNGGTNLINSYVTITQDSPTTYTIGGLSALTASDGNYTLTVSATGVSDFFGDVGTGSQSTSWATGTDVPVVVSVGAGEPSLRNTPVDTVDVVLSEPIVPGSFNYQALSLTLDGGPNLITSSVTVTEVDPMTFRIGGLGALTTADGNDGLTVSAGGLVDGAGHSGVGFLSENWTMNTVGPTVASFPTYIQTPRNIVVPTIDVIFSEPIVPSTFTYQDITYSKPGGPNLILPSITITELSPTEFAVSNFNNFLLPIDGTYTFTVSAAGVMDLYGNSGTGLLSTSWDLVTIAPAAPTDLAISPNTGASAGVTNTGLVTLTGSLAESGLSVDVMDGHTDLGYATVSGTTFSMALNLPAGANELQVTATDAAGNVSPTSTFNVIAGETPPAITSVAAITPSPRNAPVASVDVTLSEAINAATFTTAGLNLTDNGGPNLITGAVTISLVPGTTSTYQIGGLSGLTTAEGTYTLTVDASGIQDDAGNFGSGSMSTSWLMDTTPPTSTVGSLPAQTTSTSVLVSASGTDPNGSNGSTPSGVASIAIYDSTDGGPYNLFATVTPTNPSAVFTAQAGHAYGFYSIATDNAGNVQTTPTAAQATIQILAPLSVTSVAPVSPNPRNTPVSTRDVTFSEPVTLTAYSTTALTLTDNGGANVITSAVTISLVSGSTYQIGGLSGLTSAEGGYTLTVNAAAIKDTYGNPGSGSLSTSWLMDTTPPTSTVNALPAQTTSTSFVVSVTGSDPTGANGSTPSGVASFAVYDSEDSGGFTFWTTVTPVNPFATFTGQASHTYGFYSVATDNAGNVQATPTAAQETVLIISPLSLTSIAAVSPNPRNTAVSSIDVTFSVPIRLSTFNDSNVTLTDNGGGNLITSAVTFASVSGSTYQINGLSSLTANNGNYTLSVNAAGIDDQNGNPGSGTLSTSWLMDTAPPTSHVNALPQRGTSLVFAVSATGTDGGSPPSGVASYTIYSSTNGGPWMLWTTVPASNPSASFTGQSNTTYAFYSIAHDLAGNTESKKPLIEASTYLPDLTPPLTSVDGTTGANPSSVNSSTGTFTLDLTGSDPGGGLVTYFTVFASVDGASYQELGPYAIPAGAADSKGSFHSTIIYQGLTDGQSHTYSFYSIGLDSAGNLQSAPSGPNVTFANQVFAQPGQLQVIGFTVEHGSPSRSYVRYLDLAFNQSDSQSGGELTSIVKSISTSSPEIQIYKYDLNGDASSKTAVPLSSPTMLDVLDHAIEIDFGAGGIGGNPNTTAADGYYEVDIKLPSGQTAVHHFYRLLGDVNGDTIVDQNDLNEIAASIGETSPVGWTPLSADVTGAGTVTAFDLTLATRSKGRKLGSGLSLG
ncbi:MAG: SdrD B-like domain-containing protein [Isosphaerales bacterium]